MCDSRNTYVVVVLTRLVITFQMVVMKKEDMRLPISYLSFWTLCIKNKCSGGTFFKCCREEMKMRKSFRDVNEAADFLKTCKHFVYKRSYLDFSLEGNLFENAMQHAIRYFSNIHRRYDGCIQNLSYIRLMTKCVKDALTNLRGGGGELADMLSKVGLTLSKVGLM